MEHQPIPYLHLHEKKYQSPVHPLYHRNNATIQKQRARCANGFYFAFCGLQSCGSNLYVFGPMSECDSGTRSEFPEWLFINFIEINDPVIIQSTEQKIIEMGKKNKEYTRYHSGLSCIKTKNIDAYIEHASMECMQFVQSREYVASTAILPFSNFASSLEELERVTRMTIDYKSSSIKHKLIKFATSIEDAERIAVIIKDIKL